jgi:hypothetical protein
LLPQPVQFDALLFDLVGLAGLGLEELGGLLLFLLQVRLVLLQLLEYFYLDKLL